ncbi:MAG: 3-hydroxyacyl-CoA dehydrogenase [Hyphomicrobiaceae bacterium]
MPVVGLIGVGLIGRSWANVFARAGWEVRITDSDSAVLGQAAAPIADTLHDLARHGLVSDPGAAAARVRTVSTLEEAVAGADFVQESGPETLQAKIEIYRRLDAAAPEETVLASSTSAIVASRFTEDLAGRTRCLVAHPVNPPHVVPIVELCGAPWTAPEAIEKARTVFASVGQVPIVVRREIDGFILNRLQAVLLSEAFRLVGEGYCTAEDLDKTIRDGLGLRWAFMGPFETIELNAPGGTPDYCTRYGETLYRLSSRPVTPDVWEAENTARVVASWGHRPTEEEIKQKSRWRDDRLAALIAHKRQQKPFDRSSRG